MKKKDDNMKKSGIYCIENLINGKKYIGQSNDVYTRWSKHKSALNNDNHDNDYLQKSWNKYGADNFKFYVLEFCEIEKLNEREIYYIELCQSLDRSKGYNIAAGGGSNAIMSAEHRARIRNALVGHKVSEATRRKVSDNHADVSGEKNPMYGRHHSEEAKRKVSEANQGRISVSRNLTPVRCIDLNQIFDCAAEAGKIFGIQSGRILQCCYGNRKTTGGYQWEFINLENNIC